MPVVVFGTIGRVPSVEDPLRRIRPAIAALGLLRAPVFFWAAVTLPWGSAPVFLGFSLCLGLLHLGVAVTALFWPVGLTRAWRLEGLVSCLFCAYAGWIVTSSAGYLLGVYGRVGAGLSAALLTAFSPVVLLTVPTAVWAWASAGGIRGRHGGLLVALVATAFAVEVARWRGIGEGQQLASLEAAQRLETALPSTSLGSRPSPSLMSATPARCPRAKPGVLQAVLTYASKVERRARSACLVAKNEADLADAVEARLHEGALGSEAKLDLFLRAQALARTPPLVRALAVRAGLDGVCAASQCLMPWQLVGLDRFETFAPLAFIPDLKLGVDPGDLRRRLGLPPSPEPYEGLSRLATASFVRGLDGRWRRFVRLRPTPEAITGDDVRAAGLRAESYVLSAQLWDGRFRYRIQPFAGRRLPGRFSLARQAGTTLALCELGSDPRTSSVAAASLGLLSRHVTRRAGVAALGWPPGRNLERTRLGPSALGLAAFLTCRARRGLAAHDAVIGDLGELLLGLQTPSGRFAPQYDLVLGRPIDGPFRLFADGQAVLALVLLARQAEAAPGSFPRTHRVYTEAAARAMRFYGERYWQVPAREFFFLEENWHCLAARAALDGPTRVDAYERLCLDYVRFKARLILSASSQVYPEAVGGYGFLNLVMPQATPTAGFGEAAAAALAVARARAEALPEVARALERALAFLVRSQWTEATCFACSERFPVVGGWSKSLVAPEIRIDYVQHAWAALGHGGRALAQHAGRPETSLALGGGAR